MCTHTRIALTPHLLLDLLDRLLQQSSLPCFPLLLPSANSLRLSHKLLKVHLHMGGRGREEGGKREGRGREEGGKREGRGRVKEGGKGEGVKREEEGRERERRRERKKKHDYVLLVNCELKRTNLLVVL